LQIGSKKNFYRAFSNSIRFNGTSVEIWLVAIYFEFELNSNPFRARQLFMKALKLNTRSISLWIEYFQFECKFIKMVERREDVLKGQSSKKEETETGFDEAFEPEDFLAFGDSAESKALFTRRQEI
jgi:hypothetical protein